MIQRIYTEKKPAYAQEATNLLQEAHLLLGLSGLQNIRILNRYDVEGISPQLFQACRNTVFAEPQVDLCHSELPTDAAAILASEYLPGQFDQRADSCAQCIQFAGGGERPRVATARIYLLYGQVDATTLATLKRHLINPVESREASLALPLTLENPAPPPPNVPVLSDFLELNPAGLRTFLADYALAMDLDDLAFCQQYFRQEGRCPTLTEIRLIDTYWSDHCRHTTFSTRLTDIKIDDALVDKAFARYLLTREALGSERPITFMDIATIGAKYLYRTGQLAAWDRSDEVNACTVKIEANIDGRPEPWLLLFKNETHNHPTEIEPFGGAATCIGGAIRDPLSGRGFVYQAMRVTGAADPTQPISETLPGKLPQRTITQQAAAGYSSYGNQIGLATGLVDELYHPGYLAKRMEVGAVIAAAPAENVRREEPAPGDLVVLLGGRTGRDGCGGATGSSKSHDTSSLATLGAEVQKGNAPEERKLQRLFRNSAAAKLIKRCNDFGAGGVSVAIGELADGLAIDLDMVPKKYEGLDGTELAISESQERMAVVLSAQDLTTFSTLAAAENLEATVVAQVTAEKCLTMRWRGETIVNLKREFLNSNGAPKESAVQVAQGKPFATQKPAASLSEALQELVVDLNICSKRGLAERFDSTVGTGSVTMPFGGSRQRTPQQAMAARLPVEHKNTTTCSLMAYGFNPYISTQDPYAGAYLAVVESVAKLVAAGVDLTQCWLSFQEYFPKLGQEAGRWGLPFAALLGALSAQLDLQLAAIGGKDSMSGSFEKIDVPPTLISFAAGLSEVNRVVTPEFKKAGSRIVLLSPEYGGNGLPEPESLRAVLARVAVLIETGQVQAAYTPGYGGLAEGLFKMGLGNRLGLTLSSEHSVKTLTEYRYGSFILELADDAPNIGIILGHTTAEYHWRYREEDIPLNPLEELYENRLEEIFPCNISPPQEEAPTFSYAGHCQIAPRSGFAQPRVVIPAFPGTNCEYDTARAFAKAGALPKIVVVRNLTPQWLAESLVQMAAEIEQAQILALPGGFSGGDEPDGSGKFICNFFRNAAVQESVMRLLNERDGLICGICNGFQALIKLGLLPYGEIRPVEAASPTITYNAIGRHQSKLVHTRVASVKSPWLSLYQVGDIRTAAVSHGEGRFVCEDNLLQLLVENGQIATQYVDAAGKPTLDIQYNPNGALAAVEGLTSPDGRIFGRMAHPERWEEGLLKNVPGQKDCRMFAGAVHYYKI